MIEKLQLCEYKQEILFSFSDIFFQNLLLIYFIFNIFEIVLFFFKIFF